MTTKHTEAFGSFVRQRAMLRIKERWDYITPYLPLLEQDHAWTDAEAGGFILAVKCWSRVTRSEVKALQDLGVWDAAKAREWQTKVAEFTELARVLAAEYHLPFKA